MRPLRIEGAEQRGRVRLQPTATERDQHKADPDAGQSGQHGQRDVPGHHNDAAVEQGALHAEQPVGDPAAEHRGQVDQTTVGANQADRGVLGQTQTAVGRRIVQVVPEDGDHSVERKTLPQLDSEEVDQPDRVAEQGQGLH